MEKDETIKMIGANMAAVRKSHKCKQYEVSEALGVTKAAVSNWERGKYSPPYDVLIYYCKRFDCDPAYLLGMSDHPGGKAAILQEQLDEIQKRLKESSALNKIQFKQLEDIRNIIGQTSA